MTTTDLAIVPYTGEVLDLQALTFAQLGELLDSCREWERSDLSEFKQDVQAEVLHRMDQRAASGEESAWTVRDGRYKLSGDSPDRSEYPIDELRVALSELVGAGVIAPEAAERVIVPSGWKVARRPLTQLMKVPGVAARLREVERPVERPRRVTVTWEGQR